MTALHPPPTSRSPVKLTARQFEQMPDPPAAKLELVHGEILVHSSPKPLHAWTLDQLHMILRNYIAKHRLGMIFSDVNTLFDEYNVRRPDLLYFRKTRQHLVDEQKFRGLPDLAVEVISPSSTEIDRHDKFVQYARSGIPYYWIVDPSMQSIEGYELRGGDYQLVKSGRDDQTLSLPPFEDLELPLGELWWVSQG